MKSWKEKKKNYSATVYLQIKLSIGVRVGCTARTYDGGVLFASSLLLLRVHLSVCRLRVSIILSPYFRDSPGCTTFSISISFDSMLASCSRLIQSWWVKGRVSTASIFAEHASWFAHLLALDTRMSWTAAICFLSCGNFYRHHEKETFLRFIYFVCETLIPNTVFSYAY